jgi:BlaI family transcriptional regulator, penicillinase repressor
VTHELHRPTDAELDILRVLWAQGPCTVRRVHDQLNAESPRRYTTVLKMLQIMSAKGLVERDETLRAHVYRARADRSQTQRNLVSHLVSKAFAGSGCQLVVQTLSSQQPSPAELVEIRQLLDTLESGSAAQE